jgi:hypothetical protein
VDFRFGAVSACVSCINSGLESGYGDRWAHRSQRCQFPNPRVVKLDGVKSDVLLILSPLVLSRWFPRACNDIRRFILITCTLRSFHAVAQVRREVFPNGEILKVFHIVNDETLLICQVQHADEAITC